ncbi:hypothetical protein EMIT0158MI4_270002 [Burkholderia ambifaria]
MRGAMLTGLVREQGVAIPSLCAAFAILAVRRCVAPESCGAVHDTSVS